MKLGEGVLREPVPDEGRIVLWLPGEHGGGFRHWERVASVPGAAVTEVEGVCSTAATLVRARQRVRGFFGKLLGLGKAGGDATWVLPNGEAAEQAGERQTDLLLVWADADTPLDEARLKARWPEATRFRKLGENLFLAAGVRPPADSEPAPAPPRGDPRAQAEQLLAAARQAGDRRREASALTDLGVTCLRGGDARRAVALLDEALAITRQLGDRTRESDVLGNLGLAALAVGQTARAWECLEQQLAYARAAGDRFEEKTALFNQGMAASHLRDHARAVTAFEQALALARAVGDRQHQADLLWWLAIEHAELGQRDRAGALGQQAIDLLRTMGSPHVGGLADSLAKYLRGETGSPSGVAQTAGAGAQPGAFFAGWAFGGAGAGPPAAGAGPARGPGLLRMALSAAKAVGKFIGSGMKTVAPAAYQQRLRTCATCEHHTGVRCRLCGCFTSVKAWLPHENCPAGKWPT
jgi:tetratricopeptide (TPR) repeat protein